MYALLMYADPAHTRAMSEQALADVARKHEALRSELGASGELRGGAGLVLPDETTVVRPGSAGVVTSQGPLVVGTPEHLTAYYERRRVRLPTHRSPPRREQAAAR